LGSGAKAAAIEGVGSDKVRVSAGTLDDGEKGEG